MKASRQRLFILTLLFIVTAINYMDRANLAVAGSNIQNDFSLTPTQLGLLFLHVYGPTLPVKFLSAMFLIALAHVFFMVVRLFCGVFLPL